MASRKEQKEALRAERERREQEAAAAERRKRLIGYGAAGALSLAAVIAIVAVVLAGGGGGGGEEEDHGDAHPSGQDVESVAIPAAQATDLDAAAKAADCKFEQHESAGSSHVPGEVRYRTNPPSSGDHNEAPAEDGIYVGEEAPAPEQLVHSLEHGRVVFWYQPNASPELQGQLKSLFDEDNYHVIVAPNGRDMPSQIAASSWTRTLTCERVTDRTWDALRMFRDRYRDQAPERVP